MVSGDAAAEGIMAGRREAVDLAAALTAGTGPQAVFVMAVPGVGTSGFLDVVAERAADAAVIERIHASPALQHVPFGILAPYTSTLAAEDAASPVAVLRALRAYLQELNKGCGLPLVLMVDDAHHIDEPSAAILADMVAAGWLRVIAAACPRPGLPHPLSQLWVDGLAERIDLHPLDRGQLADALASALGSAVPASFTSAFWQATQGNPLLVTCLVRDARTEGIIVERNGRWQLKGALPADGPELVSYVAQLVARRPGEQQLALHLIALAGPVMRGPVEELCGAEVVRQLIDQHLVTDSGGRPAELEVRHPIIGAAIRARITVSRSLQLRLLLQGANIQAPSPDAGLRDVEWALECGQPVSDPELLQAAATALTSNRNALAARLAGMITTGPSRTRARAVAARARFNLGDYAVALTLLEQPGTGLAPDDAVAVSMLRTVSRMACGGATEEVFPGIGNPGTVEPPQVRAMTTPAIEERGAAEEPSGQDQAANVLDLALAAEPLTDRGRLQDALDRIVTAAAATSTVDHTLFFFEEFVLVRAAAGYLGMGEWAAAERELDRYSERHCGGHGLFDATMEALRGYSCIRQGKIEHACRVLLPAADALRYLDPLQLYRFSASLAFYAAARMGDQVQARRLVTDIGGITRRDWPGQELRAAAYVHAGKEYLERDGKGLAALREHCTLTDVSSRPLVLLECLLLCMELGDQSLIRPIADVAAGVDGPWADGVTGLAHLWFTKDGDELLEGALRLADAGFVNLAREAYLRAGTLLQKAGDTRRHRQSVSLLQKCDDILGFWHHDGGNAPGYSIRLTRRERDIAELAVQGLPDKDIAQRLMVSVRTVEGHLYRTYAKLGVRSRDELPTVLPRPTG